MARMGDHQAEWRSNSAPALWNCPRDCQRNGRVVSHPSTRGLLLFHPPFLELNTPAFAIQTDGPDVAVD